MITLLYLYIPKSASHEVYTSSQTGHLGDSAEYLLLSGPFDSRKNEFTAIEECTVHAVPVLCFSDKQLNHTYYFWKNFLLSHAKISKAPNILKIMLPLYR